MFPLHAVMKLISGAGKSLVLAAASMIPVVELRGAIPLGVAMKAKWYQTFLCTAAGNFLPIPFVLQKGDSLIVRLRKYRPADRFFSKISAFMDRRSESFRKNAVLTLIVVIAAPFTGIGAWGASIMVHLLGLNKRNSLLAITAGILISGIFTTLCAYGLVQTVRFFL